MIANERKSTTVEITIGYLTKSQIERLTSIYNSRNYYRLLNTLTGVIFTRSTTVEITIGYLTQQTGGSGILSTTVEITIGYLTMGTTVKLADLQQ